MESNSWDQLPLDQLEREYSPSSLAPDFLLTIKRYQALSAQVLPDHVKRIAYGAHPDEFVLLHVADLLTVNAAANLPAYKPTWEASKKSTAQSAENISKPESKQITKQTSEQSATLVFIHGGYWQELSALDSMFGARAIGCLGINWAAINYGLAPTVSLDVIVQRCKLALMALAKRNSKTRFVLAGSSAGAHQAGVCHE